MRLVNGSLEFLRRISRRRRSAQGGLASISDYIEESAALLTAEYLDELRAELPLLNIQCAAMEAWELCKAVISTA
jgi:hypothetical protein